MLRHVALLVSSVLLLASVGDAYQGTATRYTYPGFGGDEGKCGYKKLSSRFPTGRYFAAWPDNDGSMCGKCFEVSCRRAPVTNLYGEHYTHTIDVCKDPNKKITLMITDSCPCNQNQKWCCGGNNHLDMSDEAMRALSNQMGIMAITYNEVPCPGRSGNSCRGGQRRIKAWQMCGGIWGESQDKCCPPYHKCTKRTPFWYQCLVDPSANWNDGSGGTDNGSSNSGNNNPGSSSSTKASTRRRRTNRRTPTPKSKTVKKPSGNTPRGCKQISQWGQCGGIGGPSGNRKNGRDGLWSGYCCNGGRQCKRHNNWFWQCM